MPGRALAEAELGQAPRLPDQRCDQLQAAAISRSMAGLPFAAFSPAGVLRLAFY